ncbi:MAG: 4Fe-4S binding protein [Planctomycetota bacterium]|jgi:hypothetical protein
MIPEATKGFLLGLSTGALCLTHCAAILLPTLAVTRDGSVRASLLRLLEFSLGRGLAYLGVGFVVGWAGAFAPAGAMPRLLGLLYVPLAGILLLHVLREVDSSHWICRFLEPRRKFLRTPFLLGTFSGLAPCAPFGLAMVALLEGGEGTHMSRALKGLVFFGAFFLGTTVFLLPLVSAGVAARFEPVRRLARALAAAAALFFLFSGLSLFLHEAGKEEPSGPLPVEEGDLRIVFPEADAFSSVMEDGPFPYRWALRKVRVASRGDREVETTTKLGVCFVTTEVVSGSRGWAGEIPVLMGLAASGEIRGIRVLPGANRETPGFIDPLYGERFQEQYRGLKLSSPIEVGADVDSVTGATQSVDAVNADIGRAGREAARSLLGLDPERPASGGSAFPARPGLFLFASLLVVAVGGTLARAGFAFRLAVMIASILVLGVWQGFYLTGSDLSRALTLDLPPGPARLPWVVLITLAFLVALTHGKIYCAWICPFGALSEILHRVVPVRLGLTERADRYFRNVRWIFLLGLPAVVVVANDPGALRFEPLSSLYHPRSLTIAGGVLLGAALLGSALVERFYCKFICPLGALFDLFTASRILGRKKAVVCGGCTRGEKGCRFLKENGEDFKGRRDQLRGDCIC